MAKIRVLSSDSGDVDAVREFFSDAEAVDRWPDMSEDLVLLVATDTTETGRIAGGNPLVACLDARRRHGHLGKVFLIAPAETPSVDALASFCLADGIVWRHADGLDGLGAISGDRDTASRVDIDALLERLESDIQKRGEQAAERALSRLKVGYDDESLLQHLTDPETGLYDGPFAAFKLDEEVRRSVRFHDPFSILLIECRMTDWGAHRQMVLAELAGMFLDECRDIDAVARFDESTFLFLLPGTPPDGVRALAGRLGASIAERQFTGGIEPQVRFGVASAPGGSIRNRRDLLAAAEADLHGESS